jgi:hypothetical protein|uniref:Uncharacterized protein n=1 Tax=Myoviridae sp. ctYA416 TaxID=2825125 RepID=A0A8S5UTE6_9CAUD|nr:MAG TPA: hypothetical protein [Myoviridae sp. ctYA416]
MRIYNHAQYVMALMLLQSNQMPIGSDIIETSIRGNNIIKHFFVSDRQYDEDTLVFEFTIKNIIRKLDCDDIKYILGTGNFDNSFTKAYNIFKNIHSKGKLDKLNRLVEYYFRYKMIDRDFKYIKTSNKMDVSIYNSLRELFLDSNMINLEKELSLKYGDDFLKYVRAMLDPNNLPKFEQLADNRFMRIIPLTRVERLNMIPLDIKLFLRNDATISIVPTDRLSDAYSTFESIASVLYTDKEFVRNSIEALTDRCTELNISIDLSKYETNTSEMDRIININCNRGLL